MTSTTHANLHPNEKPATGRYWPSADVVRYLAAIGLGLLLAGLLITMMQQTMGMTFGAGGSPPPADAGVD